MDVPPVDYLVVGAGLTGATIARRLADAGREVMVIDRRAHLGGNVHDYVHESGIRVHTYGPHYFRTSSHRIWQFVNRFDVFRRFEAVVMTNVEGRLERWPVSWDLIRRTVGEEWKPGVCEEAANFEEASLALMPREVYEMVVRGYTMKQWGMSPATLSPKLARRLEVREERDVRLSRHRWQGIPCGGYARWIKEMLKDVPVRLNCDFSAMRGEVRVRKQLIYTGPIDEFFGCDLGQLAYRAQAREVSYLATEEFVQPVVQVNNPSCENGAHIRTIEWKHLMPPDERSQVVGTVLTREVPVSPRSANEYEYPFPDERNASLYQQYRARASGLTRTIIAGRLGEYRYLDMDQAIGRAMAIAKKQLGV